MRILLASVVVGAMAAPLVDSDLFVGGEGGYACYRLPNLVQLATPGHLLAFAQGDRDRCDDIQPPHHVVMKRSADNGQSWSNMTVVYAEDDRTIIGNPSVVVDPTTDTVHLFITRNFTEIFLLSSADAGHTWAPHPPRNLTAALVPPRAVTVYTGLPQGAAIALPGGKTRLMICANYLLGPGESLKEGGHAFTIYSDDHAATWLRGRDVDPSHMGECSVVQTARGGVIMYAHVWRHDFDQPQRTPTKALAYSSDFGVSFSDGDMGAFGDNPSRDEAGGFAVAAATTAGKGAGTDTEERDVFLASSGWGRDHYPFVNFTVMYSRGGADGRPTTWQPMRGAVPLWAGPSSYSTVFHPTMQPDTFFVCYERGNASAYEVLRLTQLAVPHQTASEVVV